MSATENTPTEGSSPKRAAIVIAHGSRATAANDAHIDACRQLAERMGRTIVPAFLELAEPSLSAAVDTLTANGHRHIDVLPLFLYPGRHSTVDIPELIAAASAAHHDVEIRQLAMFGSSGAVLDELAAQLS